MFIDSSNLTAPCTIEQKDVEYNNAYGKDMVPIMSEICCELFRKIFDFKNIEYIMDIMKFTLGAPLPQSFEGMGDLTQLRQQKLFPVNGNLSSLEDIG